MSAGLSGAWWTQSAVALVVTLGVTLGVSVAEAQVEPPLSQRLVIEASDAEVTAEADAGAAAGAKADEPLTEKTIARAIAPPHFRFSIIRSVLVDDLSGTYLYVRANKTATTKSVPVPADRTVLASCIAGGNVDDLVRGATVTVRFDPAGRYRPDILVEKKVEVEALLGAKVLDRGGNKLYIVTSEGKARGFEIEGDAKAWNDVVAGGDASGLLAGAVVDVHFDPSGRSPLRVKIITPAGGAKRDSDGCGCSLAAGGAAPTGGAVALIAAALALILRRRSPA